MRVAYKHNFELMTVDKTWLHTIDFRLSISVTVIFIQHYPVQISNKSIWISLI